jgi:hypothetical protein
MRPGAGVIRRIFAWDSMVYNNMPPLFQMLKNLLTRSSLGNPSTIFPVLWDSATHPCF